jgi:hypothetical protein
MLPIGRGLLLVEVAAHDLPGEYPDAIELAVDGHRVLAVGDVVEADLIPERARRPKAVLVAEPPS